MAEPAIVPAEEAKNRPMAYIDELWTIRKWLQENDRGGSIVIATESQPAALAPPDVAVFSFGLCILIAHTHCSMNPLDCDHSLPRGMHLFSELQELRLYGGHPLPVSLERLNHRL
jgi:hypothetical protein